MGLWVLFWVITWSANETRAQKSEDCLPSPLSTQMPQNVIHQLEPKPKLVFSECGSTRHQAKIAETFQAGLEEGIHCMIEKGSEEIRAEARSLQNLLREKSIQIGCGKSGEKFPFDGNDRRIDPNTFAMSLSAPEANSPGLIINQQQVARTSQKQLRGVYLHEALHWIGIRHRLDFDTPYVVQYCCMSSYRQSQKIACDLMSSSPRLDRRSPEYVEKIVEMLVKGDRPGPAANLVEQLLFESAVKAHERTISESVKRGIAQLKAMQRFEGRVLEALAKEFYPGLVLDQKKTKRSDDDVVAQEIAKAARLMYGTATYDVYESTVKQLKKTLDDYVFDKKDLEQERRAKVNAALEMFDRSSLGVVHSPDPAKMIPPVVWESLKYSNPL